MNGRNLVAHSVTFLDIFCITILFAFLTKISNTCLLLKKLLPSTFLLTVTALLIAQTLPTETNAYVNFDSQYPY